MSPPQNYLRLFKPGPIPDGKSLDLSVIIPTYNRAERLSRLLSAWLEVDAFTSVSYELIFSDDGSEDQTRDILKSYQQRLPIQILENQHAGPASARNSGIASARGQRLLFLGDDIYPAANLLDVHVSLGCRLGKQVAILGKVDWHPEQEQNHLIRHITEIGQEQFSYSVLPENSFTDFWHFYTCNVSVSREMLATETIKFDTRFYKVNFEDIELAYRLSKRGMKIYYAPSAYALHYHEYDVRRFSLRQETAGEMARVFVELHPEIDNHLRLSDLIQEYLDFQQTTSSVQAFRQQLPDVLKMCEKFEEDLNLTPEDSHKRKQLSLLYSQLFKQKFSAGVLSGDNFPDRSRVEQFLYDRYFGRDYCNQLCGLTISAEYDTRELNWFHLLQSYFRLLHYRLIPFSLGELGELISDSVRQESGELQAQPDLKQLALNQTRDYLRQFSLLRRTYQRIRRLSLRRIRLKIRLTQATDHEFPRVAIISGVMVDPEVRQEFFQELGRSVLFVTQTERGFEFETDHHTGVTDDLRSLEFDYALQIRDQIDLPRLFQFKNALLSLASYWYEYLLISWSYQWEPVVGIRNLPAQLFLKRKFFFADSNATLRMGRIIRLLPAPPEVREVSLQKLFPVTSAESKILKSPLTLQPSRVLAAKVSKQLRLNNLAKTGNKKVVFVFPVYLAVGGAERNLIVIMKALQPEYHFVVITTEKHSLCQGSLHHQVQELTSDIYDLAEIAAPEDFLNLMQALQQSYRPELLLITNGSPWLLAHSQQIRKLFADIPIIDHQVYDQQAGWINHYTDPGIQSFDRFVAINQKIESVMETDKGIPRDRISQIYHALDSDRFRQFSQSEHDAEQVCHQHGLSADADYFIFLARLAPQKRPLLFLEMLKLLQESGSSTRFLMVGNGELQEQVDAYVRSAGLQNLVRIPFVENPLDLIAISRGMIFTSAFEGLPVAMLEALSLGVPVLSTDVGDVGHILEEYSAGMTIPVDSSATDLVQYFLQFQEKREQYVGNLQAGRKKILDRFSVESISAQYDGLFRESIQFKKAA